MIDDAFNPNPEGSDRLAAGFYLLRMHRSGRVSVPIRVWFGPPEDPDQGSAEYIPVAERQLLDRSPRWQIEINGVLFGDPDNPACIAGRPVEDVAEIWPRCGAEPLHEDGPTSPAAQAEYDYRVARAVWAEAHDASDPFGGTGARVDPMTAPLPFFEFRHPFASQGQGAGK